jgi:hypothetical protein
VAAAVALYRADAPRTPLVLLVLPATFLSYLDHAFPFGSLAFGSFFVDAAWLELASGRSTLAGQPRRVNRTSENTASCRQLFIRDNLSRRDSDACLKRQDTSLRRMVVTPIPKGQQPAERSY